MASFRSWWLAQRSSTRLAFLLQIASRAGNSFAALLWMRVLSRAMGDTLYGLFVNFQSLAALGGLGDLGLGAVVAIRTGQHLGEGRQDRLRSFLASARGVFLVMALLVLGLGMALSPWLPGWLGLTTDTESPASMTMLFCLGAAGAALVVAGSYLHSLNYAVGNITWPIVPIFIATQAAILCHWLLARSGASLALQYLPYVASSAAVLLLVWKFIHVSHPSLSALLPVHFGWREWLALAGQSFWSYLWSIGFMIYTVTDRALITKGFGGAEVTRYHFSSKLIELAFFVVVTAGSVSLPKITQWLASPHPEEQAKATAATAKLNDIQAFLGCAVAIVYLGIGDLFVGAWFGTKYRIPLDWQFAFAISLAISACGAAAMQLSPRGPGGIRYSGIVVATTGLLNLGLSFAAMKLGSIFGIIFATGIAQLFFTIVIGRFVCGFLRVSYGPWCLRNVLMPCLLVTTAYLVRRALPGTSSGWAGNIGVALVLIWLAARFTRINSAFLRSEWKAVRGMLGRSS